MRVSAESLSMMPWFPRDFLASTRGWSVTATGVYRALLDAQWDLGLLPNDPQTLKELIGASTREWNAGWKKCEAKFPVVEGGRRNERLELHRAKSLRLSEKRRVIGQKGGQASAQSRAEPIGSPIGQAIASPITEAIGQAKVNHPSPSEEREELNPAARPDLNADPDDELFKAGAQILGGSYSLLQRLRTNHGDALVLRKIADYQAMTEKPRDPKAYFLGVMKKLERRFQA
jgi:uncharacterized protein YdaU (DUF1376 family)